MSGRKKGALSASSVEAQRSFSKSPPFRLIPRRRVNERCTKKFPLFALTLGNLIKVAMNKSGPSTGQSRADVTGVFFGIEMGDTGFTGLG